MVMLGLMIGVLELVDTVTDSVMVVTTLLVDPGMVIVVSMDDAVMVKVVEDSVTVSVVGVWDTVMVVLVPLTGSVTVVTTLLVGIGEGLDGSMVMVVVIRVPELGSTTVMVVPPDDAAEINDEEDEEALVGTTDDVEALLLRLELELRLLGGGTIVTEVGPTIVDVVELKNPLEVLDVGTTTVPLLTLDDGKELMLLVMLVNGGGVTMLMVLVVTLGKPLAEEMDEGDATDELLLTDDVGGGTTVLTLLVVLGKPLTLLDDGGTNTEELGVTPVGPTEILLALLVGKGTVLMLLLDIVVLLKTGDTRLLLLLVVKFCRLVGDVDGGSMLEKDGSDVILIVGKVEGLKLEDVVLKYPEEVVEKLALDEDAVMVTVMFSKRVTVTCLMNVVAGGGQLEDGNRGPVLVPYGTGRSVKALLVELLGAWRCSRMWSSLSHTCWCFQMC